MTMRMSVTLAAAVLAVSATMSLAANVATNPGFESGDLTGWVVLNASGSAGVTVQSPDNGPSLAGTHNAFLDNRSEALGLTLKQSTPAGSAFPGPVLWSFDPAPGQAALGGVFFVEIFAEKAGGGVIGGSGLLGNYTPTAWTTYSGSFVAPANTDFLTIQFEAVTGANVGSMSSMHVDNIFLDQGFSPVQPSTWGNIKSLYSH